MNVDEARALLPRLPIRIRKNVSSQKEDHGRGLPLLMQRGITNGGFTMSLQDFLSAVLDLGPSCVLLTDGKRGAFAATERELTYCPSLKIQAVGTAGAGDAFNSTFTAIHANGSNAGEALQAAAVNASSVVKYADTQSGLLTQAGLAKTLEEFKSNLELQVSKF